MADSRASNVGPTVRRIEDAKNRERALLRERDAQRERADRLEKQLTELREARPRDRADLTDKVESLTSENARLRAELGDANAKLSLVREVLDGLNPRTGREVTR